MDARVAVSPTWTATTDGLSHLVVSVLRHSDGAIMKVMCRRWLAPAPPIGDPAKCPECAGHDTTGE
ncbi:MULTISPECIES: hypothetical protein [unclassified Amycolatopsis]|uniref:hypothetical protein n=1 Tax=unclassified Amycolatopsis TaxID=2618356 RepID=UPI00106E8BB9|nr:MULTISPECIES: hypothetical protein [unclassified Amycolatopsis]